MNQNQLDEMPVSKQQERCTEPDMQHQQPRPHIPACLAP